MSKIAILLHAEPGTHDSLGRALHALLYANELFENGDDVRLYFDGGGTKWIDELTDSTHKLSPLYEQVKKSGIIAGVCDFCIDAFDGDKTIVRTEGLSLISEYSGHPSIARIVSDGYQVITL